MFTYCTSHCYIEPPSTTAIYLYFVYDYILLSYRLPIVTFLLAPLVFEIFDLRVADKQTSRIPRYVTIRVR